MNVNIKLQNKIKNFFNYMLTYPALYVTLYMYLIVSTSHEKGKVLNMREELTYRQGYNTALQTVHDSAIRSIRWNIKQAMREIKRSNTIHFESSELTYRVRDYYLSRLYGIVSAFWVTSVITSHEYIYWKNVISLAIYHNTENRLHENDIQ